VFGVFGIFPSTSIFAQYYDDDYEKSYEKYVKDDYYKPNIQKLSCNNIIRNQPGDDNQDTSNGSNLPNGDPQAGQDRMNPNQKGNFVYICQNNNVNIENTINNGDSSFSFVHNNTLTQNQNASFTQTMTCGNAFSEGDDSNITTIISGNTISCTFTQNVTQIGNITDNTENNAPGATSPISSVDTQQPSVQSQQIKSVQNNNGISVQQQRTEDSTDLTAMEKVTKLKTQWLNQLQ
jgi:hypothetical protein